MWRVQLRTSGAVLFDFDTVQEAGTWAADLENARDNHAVTPFSIAIVEAQAAEKPSKSIDTGKLYALADAGWKPLKIADELNVSEQTVRNYLSKRKAPAVSGK